MAMRKINEVSRQAQQVLGVEASTHMKGLQVFISDIRNCPTKEQEEKRVQKELAKIRERFTAEADKMSGYDKKKYIWKLLYAYMLGYEVDFGHIQAVKLTSSNKFSEKTAGYLAISLLLSENTEILKLVVNSIKHDINSGNENVAALALNTVANIGGSEFADNLFTDIAKGILSDTARLSPYIKRKYCICLLRLYRKDQDALQPDVWKQKMVSLFQDRDVGLLTSVSGFMLGILESGTYPAVEWMAVIPPVTKTLQTMVQGECPPDYVYYQVPAPWLQTKLLRILQFFPVQSFDQETFIRVNQCLHMILTKPTAQRLPPPGSNVKKRSKADAERQNRSNAEHAVLFEAMNLLIHLEDRVDPQSMSTAAGLLGSFISSTDPNIRYLGLETMARLATNPGAHEHLERYKSIILEKMHESDISIRRQALNLLYALCTPQNWQQIVDELLEILSGSDALLQEELVLKIAILAEKNAPNFRWYVDVVFKMLESAPDSVGDDVWFRVVQVVTGFDDGMGDKEKSVLQDHAATKAYTALTEQRKTPHDTLVKLGAYMIGEFGHQLPATINTRAKFDALYKHFSRGTPQTKAIVELATVKLLNGKTDSKKEIVAFLEDLQESQDVELQQRSCELLQLSKDEDLLDEVLAPFPQYAESVQQNNPLIARLKFLQTKSRANTRAQLEEAAKSEGGIIKGRKPAGGGSNNTTSNAAEGNAKGEESEDSESGSDSSEDAKPQRGNPVGGGGPPRAGPAAGGSAEQSVDQWRQLCLVPSGRLYSGPNLTLDVKLEPTPEALRVYIMFTNPGNVPIGNVKVYDSTTPGLAVQQLKQAQGQIGPGEQAPHYLQTACTAPFLDPPKYLVEFYTPGSSVPQRLTLMLPIVLTKFVTPTQIQLPQFRSFFESITGPKESVKVGGAKVPPNQWPNYLQKGFNLFMLQESTPQSAFAAGTFATSASTSKVTSAIVLRLEYDAGSQKVRFTVKAQHAEVTQAMSTIIESYLLTK